MNRKKSKDTVTVLEARIKTYLMLAIASAKGNPTASTEYNRLAELAEAELQALTEKQAKKQATI